MHTFQTLTTTHTALFQQMVEMRAHQDQQTTILHQIQQHLGLLPPSQPDLPASSEPLTPAEDIIPPENTTTVEVQIPSPQEATTVTPEDASSPPEAPTT